MNSAFFPSAISSSAAAVLYGAKYPPIFTKGMQYSERVAKFATARETQTSYCSLYSFFFAKSYSSEIASTGQPSAQAPQLMQASASITYWVSPSLIAPQGQVSAHAPQEMH
jgi:hypothetical protein